MGKIFVKVTAEHNTDGQIRPLIITWTDGRNFAIDRILAICPAASLKGGGQGMRYTCRIYGKQVYLFCDEGRWFLEI